MESCSKRSAHRGLADDGKRGELAHERDVSLKLLKDDIEDEGEGSGEGETGRECLGLGGSGFVDWCFFSLFRSGMRPETLQERCEAI